MNVCHFQIEGVLVPETWIAFSEATSMHGLQAMGFGSIAAGDSFDDHSRKMRGTKGDYE